MAIVAVLQARVSSSRLPGKVLMPILGRPMLALQIERIRRARRIDKLVVATSTEAIDDPLGPLCESAGVLLARGSLDDVLDRVYRAAAAHAPDHLVRLTGDCPLTDPEVIDEIIRVHLEIGSDYTSNTLTPTYPDGLDAEVARFPAFEQAWRHARLRSEREHVMPYLYNHPETFRLHNVADAVDRSAMRWTVDEPADFRFVRSVYEALYPDNPAFVSDDIYRLLEREPALGALNANFKRNEGYEKSLRADREAAEAAARARTGST
jgi:spore coat polysaccharide biosynthesis protein SpsF